MEKCSDIVLATKGQKLSYCRLCHVVTYDQLINLGNRNERSLSPKVHNVKFSREFKHYCENVNFDFLITYYTFHSKELV